MPLSDGLKKQITDQLVTSLRNKISKYDFSKKSGNPLIDGIFGKYSNLKSFIHGTATTFGSDYEIIARKIASSNPNFIESKKTSFSGKISDDESVKIKDLVKNLEEKNITSVYDSEIKAIYDASSKNLRETNITIDLYLKDTSGKEYFIEMKSPDPNKKEVRAAKEDLLNVVAMKKRTIVHSEFNRKVGIIFGVYYNNNSGTYSNWKVSPMFSPPGLLVEKDFWDFLGGKGTYEELLQIFKTVEKEVAVLIKKTINSI